MIYRVLTVGLTNKFLLTLQTLIAPCDLRFVTFSNLWGISRLLEQEGFHLILIDLDCLRNARQADWLLGIRRVSFVPVIVLSSTPEQDTSSMIQFGADICVSGRYPYSMIASLAYAQLRRYTEYNHHNNYSVEEFQVGDIFIDPARRKVEVCGQPVNLRPREFSLLLYFMRNPKIVLTSEQICEHAWEMEGSYNRGVSGPMALLRKAIEPDIANPRYIETIPRIGYRFTAYHDETCDDCSSSVGLL